MDKEQIRSRSYARMIYSAQDGGPIEDQKKTRQHATHFGTYAFSLCEDKIIIFMF